MKKIKILFVLVYVLGMTPAHPTLPLLKLGRTSPTHENDSLGVAFDAEAVKKFENIINTISNEIEAADGNNTIINDIVTKANREIQIVAESWKNIQTLSGFKIYSPEFEKKFDLLKITINKFMRILSETDGDKYFGETPVPKPDEAIVIKQRNPNFTPIHPKAETPCNSPKSPTLPLLPSVRTRH